MRCSYCYYHRDLSAKALNDGIRAVRNRGENPNSILTNRMTYRKVSSVLWDTQRASLYDKPMTYRGIVVINDHFRGDSGIHIRYKSEDKDICALLTMGECECPNPVPTYRLAEVSE